MAGGGIVVEEDIEEGEISDDSLEEISEQAFKQQDAKVVSTPKPSTAIRDDSNKESSRDYRAWMTRDLYNYSVTSNYGSGFHNLAWAQAVQNKPLNEVLDFRSNREEENNNNKSLTSSNVVIEVSSEEIESKADEGVEVEKEAGELEEGEIGLDSEMVDREVRGEGDNPKELEIRKRVESISEVLDKSVTVNVAEKSFDEVCSHLRTSLESLQSLISDNGVPTVETLVHKCFAGVLVVNSVFDSMNLKQKEQNKDVFSRLLAHVKSQYPVLFSLEQMKEIETFVGSLENHSVFSSVNDMEDVRLNTETNPNEPGIVGGKPQPGILGEKPELRVLGENPEPGIFGENPSFVSSSLRTGPLDPTSVTSRNQTDINMRSGSLNQDLSLPRSRGGFGPLFDLHRDHDVDNLPSPTRELPSPFCLEKQQVRGDRAPKSEPTPIIACKVEDAVVDSYETDALTAVCSYQRKFSRTSFSNNKLPSPTPSGECDVGDGDTTEEVTSSATSGNVGSVSPTLSRPVDSATRYVDNTIVKVMMPAKTTGQVTSSLSPSVKTSAKSRDPRLRFAIFDARASSFGECSTVSDSAKGEIVGRINSSRKYKHEAEAPADNHTFKKQRNGPTNSGVSSDFMMVPRRQEFPMDTVVTLVTDGIRSPGIAGTNIMRSDNGETFSGYRQDNTSSNLNVRMGGNEQLPVTSTSSTLSLPTLLKDIAVNPAMLMTLLMEQQKMAAEAQNKPSNVPQNTYSFNSSVIAGTVPYVSTTPSTTSQMEQGTAGRPKFPSQIIPMNTQVEPGKISMKPRDPRRVLHSDAFRKNESLGPKQLKTSGAPTMSILASKDNLKVCQQGEQAQTTSLPSQSVPPPDITRQFTKKLKNLADIISTQAIATTATVPPTASPQPVKADVGALKTDLCIQKSGNTSTSEVPAGTPPSQHSWGDVEHLFEGYDDQQKAAIHRERSRRIDEQNKMFAARKLCLVLDLDHTLLNSAKFVEVEPVHEEILKKKEEQDRDKLQRHLFRFNHMSMWTKLRPGIWTFLEKARRLYELHLYTMGNKIYATEMAKVLDPTGAMFAGRVISRGDDGEPSDGDEKIQPKSKDLEGVLGMESSVVIIDDSVKVWPHNKLNLILVERYTYFPCSRSQFGLMGPSLLEIDHDERPEDGTLASSLAVIERIHHNFFSYPSFKDLDVRNVLASEQQRILAGCCILFSRIFPVGLANPQQHPLWQTAEQFGAVCTTQIDERVTHVVATSLGTDKVNWALSTGRFVVHPGWEEVEEHLVGHGRLKIRKYVEVKEDHLIGHGRFKIRKYVRGLRSPSHIRGKLAEDEKWEQATLPGIFGGVVGCLSKERSYPPTVLRHKFCSV